MPSGTTRNSVIQITPGAINQYEAFERSGARLLGVMSAVSGAGEAMFILDIRPMS
jgi:hypothetical protein